MLSTSILTMAAVLAAASVDAQTYDVLIRVGTVIAVRLPHHHPGSDSVRTEKRIRTRPYGHRLAPDILDLAFLQPQVEIRSGIDESRSHDIGPEHPGRQPDSRIVIQALARPSQLLVPLVSAQAPFSCFDRRCHQT